MFASSRRRYSPLTWWRLVAVLDPKTRFLYVSHAAAWLRLANDLTACLLSAESESERLGASRTRPVRLLQIVRIQNRKRELIRNLNYNRASILLRVEPFMHLLVLFRSRDISAGIAQGYGLDSRGSIRGGGKTFLFTIASRPALGPSQPPIQWVPGVTRPGREADQSPPFSAEAKNGGAILPLPYMFSWHSA
jgi:hypothetical protein